MKHFIVTRMFCLLLTIFSTTTFFKAQNNSYCLTKFQLIKMQKTSLDGIRGFLTNNGWGFDGAKTNQSFNYFDYTLNYNIVQWGNSDYRNGEKIILYTGPNKSNIIIYQSSQQCFNLLQELFASNLNGLTSVGENSLTTVYNENGISVEFRVYKNDYTARQFSILVYNTDAYIREIESERQKEKELTRVEEEKEENYQTALNDGNNLFALKKYNEALTQFNIANKIKYDNVISNKIEDCSNLIFDDLINEGNKEMLLNNYEKARSLYVKAKNYAKEYDLTQNKINSANSKVSEINAFERLINADDLFKSNKLESALKEYEEVLRISPINSKASEGIRKIKEIKNTLFERKTKIFSYKETNPEDFYYFKNKLNDNLKEIVQSKKDGQLIFDYKIEFDTSGINRSKLKSLNLSNLQEENGLRLNLKSILLPPSKKFNYFVQSNELIKTELKWHTDLVKFKSNSRNISSNNELEANNYNVIASFIKKQDFKYGKYTFEVKTKKSNNKSFNDINLVKYKTGAGPSCVFYSLIMPGMGTLKVTHGKKGWARFGWFLVSSSLAIGSKIHSDEMVKKYLTATNQKDIDDYYKNANVSNKVYLLSGSIAASIYIYDIIWVFSKGIKNKIDTKYLRRQLRKNPIEVQSQTLVIE